MISDIINSAAIYVSKLELDNKKLNKSIENENKYKGKLNLNIMIQKLKQSQKVMENDLDMLKIMIEETIVKIGATKSGISASMGKSRFYINQVLWRDTTKADVIIEIAEAVCKYER